MVIKSIKDIHASTIGKLHKMVGSTVIVAYEDGTKGKVIATISDEKTTDLSEGNYVNKEIIIFSILRQNLIEVDLPIKGFSTINYKREVYQVESIKDTSTFDNTISVKCKKVG